MHKNLIFDFDGTLVDSSNIMTQIFNELALKYKYSFTFNFDINLLKKITIKEKIKFFYFVFNIKNEFKEIYATRLNELKIFDGIENSLRAIKEKGYNLSIISLNCEHNIREYLQKNNFDIFDEVISAKSLWKAGTIKNFLRKYNFKNKDVLYFGDEIRDIRACKRAKIDIVSVAWGINNIELLKKEKPYKIINTPKEIIDLLN